MQATATFRHTNKSPSELIEGVLNLRVADHPGQSGTPRIAERGVVCSVMAVHPPAIRSKRRWLVNVSSMTL